MAPLKAFETVAPPTETVLPIPQSPDEGVLSWAPTVMLLVPVTRQVGVLVQYMVGPVQADELKLELSGVGPSSQLKSRPRTHENSFSLPPAWQALITYALPASLTGLSTRVPVVISQPPGSSN